MWDEDGEEREGDDPRHSHQKKATPPGQEPAALRFARCTETGWFGIRPGGRRGRGWDNRVRLGAACPGRGRGHDLTLGGRCDLFQGSILSEDASVKVLKRQSWIDPEFI
jgi:hypothetical protein